MAKPLSQNSGLENTLVGLFVAVCVGFPATLIAAWFTHIFRCLGTENWAFLIAGAIFFPIAVVHGIGVWFGAF